MIWWLAFEKKLFQFWREIWIQVLDILLQLYARMHNQAKIKAVAAAAAVLSKLMNEEKWMKQS